LQNIETEEIFCGPSTLVDELLRQWSDASNIANLVDQVLQGNIKIYKNVNKHFYLEITKSIDPSTIYRSGRIGLGLNKPNGISMESQKKFCFKFYRYFIYPNLISKGKHLAIPAMYHDGYSKKEIAKLFEKTKENTIDSYIQLFENGKKESESKYTGKKNTDNELISAMGSLHKYLPIK